jgi:hypothetical protein
MMQIPPGFTIRFKTGKELRNMFGPPEEPREDRRRARRPDEPHSAVFLSVRCVARKRAAGAPTSS